MSKLNSFSGIDDANDIIQDTFVAMLSKTELLKTLPEAKQIAYITKSLLNRARRVYSNRSRYKVRMKSKPVWRTGRSILRLSLIHI